MFFGTVSVCFLIWYNMGYNDTAISKILEHNKGDMSIN